MTHRTRRRKLTHRHGPRGSGWVWPAPSGPRAGKPHTLPIPAGLWEGRTRPTWSKVQAPGQEAPGGSSPLRAESRAERCWHCWEGPAGHLYARATGSEPAATAHWATQPSRRALVTAQAARPWGLLEALCTHSTEEEAEVWERRPITAAGATQAPLSHSPCPRPASSQAQEGCAQCEADPGLAATAEGIETWVELPLLASAWPGSLPALCVLCLSGLRL